MTKVKEGDIDRLGLLYERYHKVLFTFLYRMHCDAGVSEDLVQDVFIRILRYRNGFRGGGSFKVWMFHVARNVSNDQFKKDNRRKFVTSDIEKWNNKITDDTEHKSTEIKEYNDRMLYDALEMIEPEKKQLIVLSKLEGMKYNDIGELYGISEGNVKVRVFRALGDLKKVISMMSRDFDYTT